MHKKNENVFFLILAAGYFIKAATQCLWTFLKDSFLNNCFYQTRHCVRKWNWYIEPKRWILKAIVIYKKLIRSLDWESPLLFRIEALLGVIFSIFIPACEYNRSAQSTRLSWYKISPLMNSRLEDMTNSFILRPTDIISL